MIELSPKDHRLILGKEKTLGLKAGEVILTFDDGPLPKTTTKVLDALQEECVKATFFAVGTMAVAYPKILRRVAREGHTIAHHTQHHDRLPKYKIKKAEALIDEGMRNVEKVAYGSVLEKPRVPFFRYPYLARTKATDRMVHNKGLIAIGANIDSRDWKKVSPQKVHDKIMKLLKSQGRGIILMHDIQKRTASMLPKLLDSLKEGGYKIVHIVPEGGAPTVAPGIPEKSTPKIPENSLVLAKNEKISPEMPHSHGQESAGKAVRASENSKMALADLSAESKTVPSKASKKTPGLQKPPEFIIKHVHAVVAKAAFSSDFQAENRDVTDKKDGHQIIAVASRKWKLRSTQWIIR